MRKTAYVDVETGGLYSNMEIVDPSCIIDGKDLNSENLVIAKKGIKGPHALIEIGIVLVIDDIVKDELNMLIKPFPGDVIEKEALEKCQITMKMLDEEGLEPNKAHLKLCSFLNTYVDKFNSADKFQMKGYNVIFDARFFRKWFEKNNDVYFGSWFKMPPTDLMSAIDQELQDRGDREKIGNIKLGNMAKHFRVDLKKYTSHRALDDVYILMEVEAKFRLYKQGKFKFKFKEKKKNDKKK